MAIAMRKSLMAAAGSSSSSAPLLFSDTFTDTQGLALASHTPDLDTFGNGWTINYGTWTIDNNKAKCVQGTYGEEAAWVDCGLTTYSIECLLRSSNADTIDVAVVVRWLSQANIITIGMRIDNNQIYCRRKDEDFFWTLLKTVNYPGTLAINTDYLYRVVVTPTNIRCWIDNVLMFDIANSSYSSATKAGIHGHESYFRWDNFKLYGGDITA